MRGAAGRPPAPGDGGRTRNPMLWVAAAMLVVVIGTLAAIVVVVLFGSDEDDPSAASTPVAPTAAADGPRLTRDVPLRSAPAGDAAIVQRMAAGDALRVIGRTKDSAWLSASASGQPAALGWVPADAVAGIPDLAALPVVEAPGSVVASSPSPAATAAATEPAAPTFTPDLPDLIVESVSSTDNRLTVVVRNIGIADVTAPMSIRINGGEPVPVDIKPGEPLRPDAFVEMVLADQYVQRRATVSVSVHTDPPIEEEHADNNTLEAIVAPDLPNDLGIVDARLDGDADWLVVTVRNNSPIPVRGPLTLRVREAPPGTTLLGTEMTSVTLAPGEAVDVPFDSVQGPDLTRIEVRLATDSINDADGANDRWPR